QLPFRAGGISGEHLDGRGDERTCCAPDIETELVVDRASLCTSLASLVDVTAHRVQHRQAARQSGFERAVSDGVRVEVDQTRDRVVDGRRPVDERLDEEGDERRLQLSVVCTTRVLQRTLE